MSDIQIVDALTHKDYTVACICPVGMELAPVEAMVDEEHPTPPMSRDQNIDMIGRLKSHSVMVGRC